MWWHWGGGGEKIVTNICEFCYPFTRTEIDCVNLFLFPIHKSQLKNLHVFVGSCPFVVGFCHSEGVNTKLHPSGLVYIVLFQQQLYFSLFQSCSRNTPTAVSLLPCSGLAVQFLYRSNCMAWLANLLTLNKNISKLMFLRV
jgi:hypothetical protein